MSAVTIDPVGGRGLRVDTADGASRLLARWRPRRLVDALVAATCLAAVAADGAAGVDAWHLTCLAALVVVVVLFRLERPARRHRVVEVTVSVIVAAQPTLHLLGEMWHRAAAGQDSGSGTAHFGLLSLHLTLAAALFVGLVLTDVFVLALAGAFHQFVRLVAALHSVLPEERVARLLPTTLDLVGQARLWVAYALRRGPPRTPSLA